MAIDTAHKRFSMMGVGFPMLKLIVPAGAIGADDRAVILDVYSGIALEELVVHSPVVCAHNALMTRLPVNLETLMVRLGSNVETEMVRYFSINTTINIRPINLETEFDSTPINVETAIEDC